MSSFQEVLDKSYPTFVQMEQDAEKASTIDLHFICTESSSSAVF